MRGSGQHEDLAHEVARHQDGRRYQVHPHQQLLELSVTADFLEDVFELHVSGTRGAVSDVVVLEYLSPGLLPATNAGNVSFWITCADASARVEESVPRVWKVGAALSPPWFKVRELFGGRPGEISRIWNALDISSIARAKGYKAETDENRTRTPFLPIELFDLAIGLQQFLQQRSFLIGNN